MYIDEEIRYLNQQKWGFPNPIGVGLDFGGWVWPESLHKLGVDEDLHRHKSSEIYNCQTWVFQHLVENRWEIPEDLIAEQDLSVFHSQMQCGYLGRVWKFPDEIRGNGLFCGKVETEDHGDLKGIMIHEDVTSRFPSLTICTSFVW